jgi:hypothetical protein
VQQLEVSAINRHNRQLFDLLISAKQDRWGYGKTERLGGLEVHDHLELGRKLHREIARLLAAQDAIDIGRGTTPSTPLDASREVALSSCRIHSCSRIARRSYRRRAKTTYRQSMGAL